MTESDDSQLSRDLLFDGEIEVWQRTKGYRFGLDALLLATDLPQIPDDATVVDLGAGQGVVALVVAYHHPAMQVVAVERQDSLVELLRKNIAANGLDNIEVVHGDLREHRDILTPHSADLVLCNPPYFRTGSRRPSPVRERAEARHELHGDVGDFIEASAYVLDQNGWMQMFTPPLRMVEALQAADDTDLKRESLRFFHAKEGEDAYLVQYRWRRGRAPDFAVRPPLTIYREDRIYTREVADRIGRERR